MLFTSYNFIVFMTVVFALYYLLPKKWQWGVLLASSLAFYAFAGAEYFAFLFFTIVTVYITTILIDKKQSRTAAYLAENKASLSREDKKAVKQKLKKQTFALLCLCLGLNFACLAVCKAVIVEPLKSVVSGGPFSFMSFMLPMGISFYIFQSAGYVIDVYRGVAKAEKNPLKLALFVGYFPQLVQGPISRFNQLSDTLFTTHPFNARQVSFGLQRILWGYFKKLVLADRILPAVQTIVGAPEEYNGVYMLLVAVFYSLQIYGDFTGGIDITIGISQLFGVQVTENFNRPFFSKNTAEYWRRWHITLGTWFKDYVFYPLSVCTPMLKLAKASRKKLGDGFGKRVPVYISSLITWLITGIWHGFQLHFAVWGLANCFVIVASQECEPLYARFHNRFHIKHTTAYRAFEVLRTFLLMSVIRMLDWYNDVGLYFKQYATLFYKWNWQVLWNGSLLKLGLTVTDYIILLAGTLIVFAVSMAGRSGSVRKKLEKKPAVLRYALFALLFFAVLLLGAYGMEYNASQFIYNQF
ncbi:MAG: MBOAT family protein [Clostridia bacterium]|nr:MBOAT family protein [Clostridia bacterium]